MVRQAPLEPGAGFLAGPVTTVAPALLGGVIACAGPEAVVAIRLTEVEAYGGSDDPGSHAFRGRTTRNATMFAAPGHLYCYLSYGMHRLLNIVCQPADDPAAVLLRAGVVVAGHELVRSRRTQRRAHVPDHELARGPGCLGQAFAATADTDGAVLRLLADPGRQRAIIDAATASAAETLRAALPLGWSFTPAPDPPPAVTSARVGVSGLGGDAEAFPWRFAVAGDPSVSRFVPGRGQGSRS